VIRAADIGSRIRIRVTADVNNDLTPDGLDNHLPHAVEVDTPPTAVITRAPGGGPPPGGGGGGTDMAGPVLGGLSLAKKKVVAGAKYTDSTIRENPYRALAIAAGVGLLVGVLLGRRSQ